MSENLINQNRQQIWQNFYSVAFVGTDKGTAQLPEISSRVNPQTQQLLQTIQAQSCNAAQGLLRQIATFNQYLVGFANPFYPQNYSQKIKVVLMLHFKC